MPVTRKRSSYNKKAALRFKPYFDSLIAEIKKGRPQGMFLSSESFGGIDPKTLQNRFTDALKWLRENNIESDVDNRQSYLDLKNQLRTKVEDTGLRVQIFATPSPTECLRPDGGRIESTTQASDWKEQVQAFLAEVFNPEDCVREFTNCSGLMAENKLWLDKTCGSLGALGRVDGDKIVVVRSK